MPEQGEAQLLSLQLVSTNRDAIKPRFDWRSAIIFWSACTASGVIAAILVVSAGYHF